MGYHGDRQGVKITKGFAKKLGSYVNGPKKDIPQSIRHQSIYYEVRPAVISDLWEEVFDDEDESNSRWAAKANVLITKNDGETIQTYHEEIQVYSPCDRNTKPSYPIGTTVFVLYRGRWEIIPPTGHLFGRIISMVSTSAADYIDDGIDNTSNQYRVSSSGCTFIVFCPLTSENIPNNTGVMFQRNMSNGHWEIFASGCY